MCINQINYYKYKSYKDKQMSDELIANEEKIADAMKIIIEIEDSEIRERCMNSIHYYRKMMKKTMLDRPETSVFPYIQHDE